MSLPPLMTRKRARYLRRILAKLARELLGLGDDFMIWRDITVELVPGQYFWPVRKKAGEWVWPDAHRSIHYGLAKRGIVPGAAFNEILLPLAEGSYGVLPIAADVLETYLDESGQSAPDVLLLLRKPR